MNARVVENYKRIDCARKKSGKRITPLWNCLLKKGKFRDINFLDDNSTGSKDIFLTMFREEICFMERIYHILFKENNSIAWKENHLEYSKKLHASFSYESRR